MSVWLVRAGRYGETEHVALEKGVAVLGWDALPDLSGVESRWDLRQIMRETYPHEKPAAVDNWLSQVWAFRGHIKVGDLVVLPIKSRQAIAVGRVSGPYQYRTDLGEGARHTRPVNWLHTDLSPVAFDKDLLYAFGAFMTVSHVSCDQAEPRIEEMLAGQDSQGPDPDGGRLCDLIVVAVNSLSLRCLRLPGRAITMLRPAGGVRYEVEGQTLTVSIDREWRFGHTSHLAGEVIGRRVDGGLLAPKPLELYDRGVWDPQEEFADFLEGSDPKDVPAWLLDLLDAGSRREYEMEQVIPGTDFSQSDYDPITEAVERRDCGDLDGAFRLLQDCIEHDSRCIDAYVHLGNFRAGDLRSEWRLKEAVESYRAALAVADRTVPPAFDGLLPWAWVDNRPLHRALNGLGLCQWRLGDTAAAGETFRRLASLDPKDPFEARFLLRQMESGLTYLQFREASGR